MSKAPIMPLVTDALLGDTLHLSTEEFGAYLLIIIATWRNNGTALPDSDLRMARICRVPVRRWRERIRPALLSFFTFEDGLWHQKRLENEWAKCAERIKHSRFNGARGGRPKSLKTHNTENPTGLVEETQKKAIHIHNHIEEDSEAIASAESASADSPPDPIKVLWDRARNSLTAAGVPKARIGPLVGRWRKDYGDSAVMAAFDRAERELPADLVPFLIGCMNYARINGNGHLTAANKRFLAGREATYRAVIAAEERDRATTAGD